MDRPYPKGYGLFLCYNAIVFILYTIKVLCYNTKYRKRIKQAGGIDLNRKLKDEDMDILFRGILKLSTVEECYDFFEDLCTIAELRAMVQRFQVARMLDEGRIYSDIVQETGASTATISRVNKCLVYGSDGYRKMLDRLKEDHE